ncbi:unnamed protein product, partial [Gongylonema pulchrum]
MHLITKGFDPKQIELPAEDELGETVYKIYDSISTYMNRLQSTVRKWTEEGLRGSGLIECCSDAHPVSSVFEHRIGQLEKKIEKIAFFIGLSLMFKIPQCIP